ncbi:MAG: ParA family protein [Bacteroidota bacterium]
METKIISCAGEKGGCGKTTLNIILATNLALLYGKKVVLLDMDVPQYSVYKKRVRDISRLTREEAQDLDIYPVVRSSVDTLDQWIRKYYGKVDYIIIDFPGNLNEEMVQGLLYVEHLFIPFFLDELEIDSTAVFYKTLERNFLRNDDRVLRSINLFFNRYELVKTNKFNAVRETFEKAGMPIMQEVVMDRTIYRERYRNTIYGIPGGKENGPLGLKRFIEQVMNISKG